MEISAAEPAPQRAPRERYLASGPLILGGAITVLVALCVAFAWPTGSMVAAQPAAASTGDLQWIRLFALAQFLAFGLFALALLIIRRRPPKTAQVVGLAVIIQLLPLMAPLMMSTDALGYWNAGRLAPIDRANPYLAIPAHYPSDPPFPYVPTEWRGQATLYGPAFTVGSEGVALVVGDSATFAAWLYKAIAGALMVVLTLLVSRMARRAAFAAAFVGWNPVFAIQFAGSGHNDALMITLIIVGLWYIDRRKVRAAGAGRSPCS